MADDGDNEALSEQELREAEEEAILEGPAPPTNVTLNCNVSFMDNSDIAAKFSGHSKIKTDAGIAGLGIYIALLVQVFGILFLAIIFALWDIRGQNRRSHYQLLFAFSDILTIQDVVYILNCILTGNCDLTTYHYFVALDSLLIFCSTMVLFFVTSRHHYWQTLRGAVRFLATLTVFCILSIFIGYETFRHWTSALPD
ncbi:uncharacterized protein BDZ99DRAFT_519260 [Mytilinidion resinicola]|uniref:Uncharacterized protein n=1 Tax=Mytilinidion resinicola TaxID=574789 RepID=A0A6A6YRN7_9PEZI|nr:uncharacterized protein BDZ99DRAFT_519260 [Mytilinidion resinicola]KAF2810567.1 hypothetical protein BDZ99DRAFT_519260 [Mytilinidion resinicola]